VCFDLAQAGPYIFLTTDVSRNIDALFISPHKFLGGPNTCGILILKKELFANAVPVNIGGGTVLWVDGQSQQYLSSLSEREEGGTGNMESIMRVGFCHMLKDAFREMITSREHFINSILYEELF